MNGQKSELNDLCTCDETAGDLHSCPYAEDVGGDDDPNYCDCCSECEYQCGMDI